MLVNFTLTIVKLTQAAIHDVPFTEIQTHEKRVTFPHMKKILL